MLGWGLQPGFHQQEGPRAPGPPAPERQWGGERGGPGGTCGHSWDSSSRDSVPKGSLWALVSTPCPSPGPAVNAAFRFWPREHSDVGFLGQDWGQDWGHGVRLPQKAVNACPRMCVYLHTAPMRGVSVPPCSSPVKATPGWSPERQRVNAALAPCRVAPTRPCGWTYPAWTLHPASPPSGLSQRETPEVEGGLGCTRRVARGRPRTSPASLRRGSQARGVGLSTQAGGTALEVATEN